MIFDEPGARWQSVLLGPLLCVAVAVIEVLTGPIVHWAGLVVMGLVLVLFSSVVVYAARLHVSVRLTAAELQQGEETMPVDRIAEVLPVPDDTAGLDHAADSEDTDSEDSADLEDDADPEDSADLDTEDSPAEDPMSAPALGGLRDVPRRRTAIGLRLTDGTVVRAWARDHRRLRNELDALIAARPTD